MARNVDTVWNDIFKDYPILEEIEKNGAFEISSTQIKKYYEPRLVTKFDYSQALPQVMKDNKICILPNTTGTYILGHFNIFKDFPEETGKVHSVGFPDWIESIDPQNIQSESIAITAATITPMFADFFNDDRLISTVSGRMGSGQFDFTIGNNNISVNSSQIEIDGALESPDRFVLLEGKNILHDDFIVRQLYYPYRTFKNRVNKPIHSVFITYSNNIYRLMEYRFNDYRKYDSCEFVREKRYSINTDSITKDDIARAVSSAVGILPDIGNETYGAPFIQCDSFAKIINIIEVLAENKSLKEDDIVDLFGFTPRQGNYYYNGCRFLNLVYKEKDRTIKLTERGELLTRMEYKQRQLALVRFIAEHRVFNHLLTEYLAGHTPDKERIKKVMKVYNACGESLIDRRASSVAAWLEWIYNLETE